MNSYKVLENNQDISSEYVKNINIDNINFMIFSKEERQIIKTITYASMIKNLLNLYSQEEKTRLIQKLIQDFNKLFKKRIQKEKELCLLAILLSEKLWENVTRSYEGQDFQIELSHLTLCIFLFEEKKLQKQFLYSRQKMGKIAQTLKSDDAASIEKNNRDLANKINKNLHEYLKLELPLKTSFLNQIK